MTKRRRKVSEAAEARKERLFAGRVPGHALTLEQWRALGYDRPDTRPLTQDPIGAHPHPSPKGES